MFAATSIFRVQMVMQRGGDSEKPDFRTFIAYRVARLQTRLNQQATHLLQKHGGATMTQWRIIVLLRSNDVETLSDMAELAAIDKGLLSRNIATLVKEGLVETVRDRADRRINRLRLTAKGEELHDRISPIMAWRQRRLTRDMTPDQISALQSALDLLEAAAADEKYSPG